MATRLVIPQSPVLDNRGYLAREWLLFFLQAAEAAAAAGAGTVTNAADLGLGLVVIGAGGDGVSTLPAATDGWVVTQVAGVAAWAASGGGGGSPGGADKDIQFNNAGAFGGISPGTAGRVLLDNGAGVTPSFTVLTAANVSIADAGNYYTSTNVEGALQEGAIVDVVSKHRLSGGL